jgi:hypothetical protein
MYSELYFDENGKNIIRSMSNLKLIRRRFNTYSRGFHMIDRNPRIVSMDSKVVHSGGFNTISDYIHLQGDINKKRKEYMLMLYSIENLKRVEQFITDTLKVNIKLY